MPAGVHQRVTADTEGMQKGLLPAGVNRLYIVVAEIAMCAPFHQYITHSDRKRMPRATPVVPSLVLSITPRVATCL